MIRRIAFYFLLMVLGLLSFGAIFWWGASQELMLAEKAFQEKKYLPAVIHYEKVLLWNMPFTPFTDKALKGIATIKEQAHKEKNQVVERTAQDAQAFAFSSIQGLAKRQMELRRAGPIMPNPFWSAAVGISLLSWIGLTFFLIVFYLDKNLAISNKPGFILCLGLLASLILFWIFSIKQL